MPKYEYNCDQCGHSFERLVFMGDEETLIPCPRCGKKDVTRMAGADSLFDGISNFSALAKDYS